ncbi:hypothetical protein [Aurantimonas sp. Leaf443]|uniref:hypothetical protein n=1 Tax=Aurantimonas sp. Leaf443 TaxID=1736378 RepID=UPI0006F5B93D|nr:hypothetical protein [Aurantimonas sp. Leaf443]KQT83118.1 hypothetical protein ASG48_14190 [Aurantimonas sp. Leaf443]
MSGISRMLRIGLAPDERGPSVCGCGRPGFDVESVGIHRRTREDGTRRAFVSGVYRCGSGWLCPTCAPAVAAIRQARVQRVVEATTEHDGSFVMGLVTVSHGPADRLADLKRLVSESFAAARRGAPWERIKRRGGIAGVLVAPEVTHGGYGWHFHIHFGMACLADKADARAAGEALIERFMRAVEARGGKALRHAQGIQIAASPEAAGEYIAKGTSWELAAGSSGRKSHAAGRTPWDIAEDAIDGDMPSYGLWREFAEAMPGTRSCVVTPRLAAALGIDAEDDDETGGAFDLTEEALKVGDVPSPTWRTILRTSLAGTFLATIEAAPVLDGTAFASILAQVSAVADERLRVIAAKAEARRRTAEEAQAARQATADDRTRRYLVRRTAERVEACGGAGTRAAIAHAIAATAAAVPGIVPPTVAEVVAELARRPVAVLPIAA